MGSQVGVPDAAGQSWPTAASSPDPIDVQPPTLASMASATGRMAVRAAEDVVSGMSAVTLLEYETTPTRLDCESGRRSASMRSASVAT